MTFGELLTFIIAHSKYDIADGDAAQTLQKARDGTHQTPLAGQIVASLFEKSGLEDANGTLERAQAINALGPIRLVFMKDDAPVEGFRMVENIVHVIDSAYNEEAFRMKAAGKL